MKCLMPNGSRKKNGSFQKVIENKIKKKHKEE